MEERRAENLLFDRPALEGMVSHLEDELQEARKREKHLFRLLEQEQKRNAALEQQLAKGPQPIEVPKDVDIRENRAKLLECLQNHYPHPLSPKQIQRFLSLPSNPVYTWVRMAKAGILKRPYHGLYAIADEHVQVRERLGRVALWLPR